ncbi:MAG TPA: topoisomerase IV [Candidatus Anaerotruncus excrementipullorum]|uniref:Topoisomerase IV n=1 Tax=Candidatus Anaerotruncus excrementipullorum TaxID=2838465 RepID=A0A9D2B7L0_9FIRM|nr:topoisomerase IV [Candidatus Anaerotruncus excrementipullorum]
MAAKRSKKEPKRAGNPAAVIENAGVMVEQPITETLEKNYMPYAMSVIVSRAIPEIDGFKPSHRKLLYTMYKMGLLNGPRTKSANVVGTAMKLNPHGDQTIYETLVRLSRGCEALLHPYVDSKGNFGKAYSRDMAYAASRYTEVKLDAISAELFRDIDQDTVDMVDNYDGTLKEPTLLPVTFPAILVNANIGIAVGMASSICPFNLAEVCETTIALLRNPNHDLMETLKAPDFPGGGYIVYDEESLRKIYETGRGTIKVRARWAYDRANNCIDITEIPPTATVEAIMDKVAELVKAGKVREVSDMRDETDLSGLKLTFDLKRGADPEALMRKLFRMTPLEDGFACNFNVLVAGTPKVYGVRELIGEWAAFREECVRRRLHFDLGKKQEKLHLLQGLERILLDIDKAIRIVRETEEEREVVPNLMIGFGIDEIQAEYVAEIRLRHLNREYILKRTQEIQELQEQIAQIEATLADRKKVREVIIRELKAVAKAYQKPRRSLLYYPTPEDGQEPEQQVPDYPVHLFFTQEGYFKKITPQSLRMSGEQKLKEGDRVAQQLEASNGADLLFFTDRCQVYKAKASDFEDGKASQLGDYIPAKLGMEEGESAVFLAATREYAGWMLFFFQNGKAAKVPLSSYATKTNRKKLLGAYSGQSPLAAAFQLEEDREFLLAASGGRMLLVHSGAIPAKATRGSQGVAVMALKRGNFLATVRPFTEELVANPHRYRTKTLPAAGQLPRPEDRGEQLTF